MSRSNIKLGVILKDGPDDPDMVLYKYVPSSVINTLPTLSHSSDKQKRWITYGPDSVEGVAWLSSPTGIGEAAVNPGDAKSICVNGMRFWGIDAFGDVLDADMKAVTPGWTMKDGSLVNDPDDGEEIDKPCCILPYNYVYHINDNIATTWMVLHNGSAGDVPETVNLSYGYENRLDEKITIPVEMDLYFTPFVYGNTGDEAQTYIHSGNWLEYASNSTPTFCMSHASVIPLVTSSSTQSVCVFGSTNCSGETSGTTEITSCVRNTNNTRKTKSRNYINDDIPKEILELGDEKLIRMYHESVTKARSRAISSNNGIPETCTMQCAVIDKLSTSDDAYTQSNTGNFESDDKAGIYPFVPSYEQSTGKDLPTCDAVPIHIYTSDGAPVDFGSYDDETARLFSFLETVGGSDPVKASLPDDISKAQTISVSMQTDFTWGGTFVVSPPCGVIKIPDIPDTASIAQGPYFTWCNFDDASQISPSDAQLQSATCYLDVYPCLMASLYKPTESDEDNNCLRTGVLLSDPIKYKQTHLLGSPKRMDWTVSTVSEVSRITFEDTTGDNAVNIPCFPTPLTETAHISFSITAALPDKLPRYNDGKMSLEDISDDTPVYVYVVLLKVLRAELNPSLISENFYCSDFYKAKKGDIKDDYYREGINVFTEYQENMDEFDHIQWGYVSGWASGSCAQLEYSGEDNSIVDSKYDTGDIGSLKNIVLDNIQMSYTVNYSHNDISFS